jgi:hypothetical protein
VSIVALANTSTGAGISSVSDGINSYTRATRNGSSGYYSEIWYKVGAAAVASGASLVANCAAACSLGTRAHFIGVQASGVTALDVANNITFCPNSSAPVSSGALAQVNDLLIGYITAPSTVGSSYTPPAQWSNVAFSGASGSNPGAALDTLSNINLVNKSGMIYYTAATFGTGASNGCLIAAFKGN